MTVCPQPWALFHDHLSCSSTTRLWVMWGQEHLELEKLNCCYRKVLNVDQAALILGLLSLPTVKIIQDRSNPEECSQLPRFSGCSPSRSRRPGGRIQHSMTAIILRSWSRRLYLVAQSRPLASRRDRVSNWWPATRDGALQKKWGVTIQRTLDFCSQANFCPKHSPCILHFKRRMLPSRELTKSKNSQVQWSITKPARAPWHPSGFQTKFEESFQC